MESYFHILLLLLKRKKKAHGWVFFVVNLRSPAVKKLFINIGIIDTKFNDQTNTIQLISTYVKTTSRSYGYFNIHPRGHVETTCQISLNLVIS